MTIDYPRYFEKSNFFIVRALSRVANSSHDVHSYLGTTKLHWKIERDLVTVNNVVGLSCGFSVAERVF